MSFIHDASGHTEMFWLHFSIVEWSGDASSIFFLQSTLAIQCDGCEKKSFKGKTGVCLVSGTRCFLVLLILKYIRQACLDKKVDINIPNKCSFCSQPDVFMCHCLFYYLCPTVFPLMCIAERIAAWVHICFRAWTLWLNIDLRSWRVLASVAPLGLVG